MIPRHHKFYIIFTLIIFLCLLVGISLFLVADYNGQNGEGEIFVAKIIDLTGYVKFWNLSDSELVFMITR